MSNAKILIIGDSVCGKSVIAAKIAHILEEEFGCENVVYEQSSVIQKKNMIENGREFHKNELDNVKNTSWEIVKATTILSEDDNES